MLIKISDSTAGGEIQNTFSIETRQEYITVEELIRLRVFSEIEFYNNSQPEYFRSLVQPKDAEVTLNGYKLNKKRKLDPEEQFYLVLNGFLKNKFFLLINDRQVEALEQQIIIQDKMELTFIKLTQLVGG